jgi:glucokinase
MRMDLSGLRLGVDVGGTRIKWALLEGDEAVDRGSIPTPTDGPDAVVQAIADVAVDLRVGSIGVAVPGHLSPDRESTTVIPNIHGAWNGFPLAASLRSRTGMRIELINDARAFALAELTRGAASDREDVLFIIIGTGLGGAVALGGRILQSPGDRTGEIGHLTVDPHGAVCSCGSVGCLETVAGGRSMARAWSSRDATAKHDANPAELVRAAELGNPEAIKILRAAGQALGVAISSVTALLGTDTVVIGGGVAPAFEFMQADVDRAMTAREKLVGKVEIRSAILGTGAGAIGAGLFADQGA